MQRATLRSILTFLFRNLTRYETSGTEYLPPGGCILATNHMSRLDVPLLYVTTPRDDLIAFIGDTYQRNLFFRWIVNASGSIWLDREKADFSAFREAIHFLRDGGILGIAPEGTRSRVGSLLQAKTGTVLLAEKTGVPVVPVAIEGTEDGMEKLRRLKKPSLHVHFGPPFTLPPIDRADREGSMQRAADEVMCRIAVMLPARYHGYYACHPRLQELLAEQTAAN